MVEEELFSGASLSPLPRFTTPLLDIVAEPPFLHSNAVMHGFFLQSDVVTLQTAVDRLFDALALNFQVVSAAVLLSALYVERTTALSDHYIQFGSSSEIDLAFWALARGSDGKLVWVPFYMFVDSGIALIAGREIYGYPKQIARFERDMGTLDRDPTVAVRTSFFPPSIPTSAVEDVLIRIRDDTQKVFEADGTLGFQPIPENQLPDLLAQGMQLPHTLGPELTPPYGTPNGISVPMLLLKQFRDAQSPDRACFQAAIAVDTESVGNVDVAVITTPVRLEIALSSSHPIAQDLGLTIGDITPPGFMIRQDFKVYRARVVT